MDMVILALITLNIRTPSFLTINLSASLAMSTRLSVLEALPGKLDIKRHTPSILYLCSKFNEFNNTGAQMSDSIYHMTL